MALVGRELQRTNRFRGHRRGDILGGPRRRRPLGDVCVGQQFDRRSLEGEDTIDITVSSILAKRAFLDPELEAIVDGVNGTRVTFRELDEAANRTANVLMALGVQPGDRVGMLMSNSPAFIEIYVGIARMGAVVVPLNWRLTVIELDRILTDCGATTLVFDGEFTGTATQLAESENGEASVERWLFAGPTDECPSLATSHSAASREVASTPPDVHGSEDDLLFIMYTSGTTGLPKGVMHTHRTSFASTLSVCLTDWRPRDRYLNCLPLFHVGALGPLNVCLYRGVTTVLMRRFDPRDAWRLIEQERITSLIAVPAVLQPMIDLFDPAVHRHADLRWIVVGGAPVPLTLLERFLERDIDIQQGYGLTECGPVAILAGKDAREHPGSAGKPYFHAEMKIVRDGGVEATAREAGEILVKSPANTVGYWGWEREAFTQRLHDGWLPTGDIGWVDEDGYLTICDRKNDIIITGGENVFPAEIENVLLGHRGVSDVAVIGQRSERWGESPCAVIVPRSADVTREDILSWCDGRIAKYKVPKVIEFTSELPRNPAGKVLKRLLRDQYPGPAPT